MREIKKEKKGKNSPKFEVLFNPKKKKRRKKKEERIGDR